MTTTTTATETGRTELTTWKNDRWERREFNKMGKVTRIDSSNDHWVNYRYDENGNCVHVFHSAGPYAVNYGYDENGKVNHVEDSNGYVWNALLTEMGLLAELT